MVPRMWHTRMWYVYPVKVGFSPPACSQALLITASCPCGLGTSRRDTALADGRS
ncbi:uncharacterized protein BDV17DRAFT_257981 [Aspergillus undulatus]|uniref:uncharacterized protein n=1 Tax=Aspergillus undulatus TaxID=1810928 RepID=UPI003CCE2DDE